MSNLCIWHKDCTDGFGAAWAAHRYFRQYGHTCDFHAGVYNDPPPDVTGRHVYLVDFSYRREVILKMLETAASLTIIDHHASAIKDLRDLVHPNLRLVFDVQRSGAILTWDYFFPDLRAPRLLFYIQDRDLWKFELVGTREVIASLYSHEFDFDVWDTLIVDELRREGIPILRAHNKLVAEALAAKPRRMLIGGCDVPVVNCRKHLASDVGDVLAKGEPFAAMYYDTPTHRIYSLRSTVDGKNVSEIAAAYGGGGHPRASGFRIPLIEAEGTSLNWD